MSDPGAGREIARHLDGLTEDAARRSLARCCDSRRWVEAMLALRPFEEDRALFEAAERFWWSLTEDDWLEAFAAHPRLGESGLGDGWSRSEQAGAADADPGVPEALAAGNREYEDRFGFVFLLCATDRSAEEMLEALQARLGMTREEELETAAGEQARITRLRLERLATGEPAAERGRGAPADGPGRSDPNERGPRVGISTHVLDTANGRPADGVRVTLERAGADEAWTALYSGATDADGRIPHMLDPGAGGPGVYRIRFDTGAYFERRGTPAFHPHAEITFTVTDPGEHHHVPLLVSPFGFTTYRGS